jgi:hypothetical protein
VGAAVVEGSEVWEVVGHVQVEAVDCSLHHHSTINRIGL